MDYKKLNNSLTIVAILLSLLVLSCQDKPQVQQLNSASGPAFGTTFSIKFYTATPLDISKGLDSIFNRVNNSVSTYVPNSDISRINNGDRTVIVDSIFRNVFELSERINKESKGYFDPTVGVLRNAYGFGDTKPLQIIDQRVLDSLMQYVGFNKVKLTQAGTIQKQNPNIYFDFNAVAKGYGIDCIAKYLRDLGLTNFLIELGGEVVAQGINLNNNGPWIGGIEATSSSLEDRSLQAKLKLENIAMASSGNYRKFRIDSVTGKRYVHTLNPLTGSAQMSDLTSATVLAKTCAEADAYATAFMALGLAQSKDLLNNVSGVEVYFTYLEGQETKTFISPGFSAVLVD